MSREAAGLIGIARIDAAGTDPGAPSAVRLPNVWRIARGCVPPVLALAIWVKALPGIDPREASDLTLIGSFPATYWIALGILMGSFVMELRRTELSGPVMALHVIALIVIIHATAALTYDTPRYAWVYKHVGVADHMATVGAVNPSIDIYNNWPGFFGLAALVERAAGLRSVLSLAPWAQLAFNLVYLPALLACYRSLSRNRRHVWLGVWMFFSLNWVGQDYFSPQGMAFFLMLVVLAAVLRMRRRPLCALGQDPAGPCPSAAWRAFGARISEEAVDRRATLRASGGALGLALFVLLIAVVVAMHQLTPIALLAALCFLTMSGQIPLRIMPVIVAVALAFWYVVPAHTYLSSHTNWFSGIGSVFSNADSSVADLTAAPYLQRLQAWILRGLVLATWCLAVYGAVRGYRRRTIDLAAIALFLSPFPIVLVQGYGGEVLFRIYLYALPWAAILAAGVVLTRPRAWAAQFAGVAVLGVLLGASLLLYFGNERMNYMRPSELAAARWLYSRTPPGSFHLFASKNFPIDLAADYARYRHSALAFWPQFQGRRLGRKDVGAVIELMRHESNARPAYFVMSTSMAAEQELIGKVPPSSLRRLTNAMQRSPAFRTVFQDVDVTILRLRRDSSASPGHDESSARVAAR